MSLEIILLMLTAASLGFFHTLLGPDHYVPFIVMAKARKWSFKKTIGIVIFCGIGHVGSSVFLGVIGSYIGFAVTNLKIVESVRGSLAAWGLIAFGLTYFFYGLLRLIKKKNHTHAGFSAEGYQDTDESKNEHFHLHKKRPSLKAVPWALFVIFVLGPCEPLIPLLMFPALKYGFLEMALVAGIFSVVTVFTMIGAVVIATFSIKFLSFKSFHQYLHAFAGFSIFMCGFAIKFLGL